MANSDHFFATQAFEKVKAKISLLKNDGKISVMGIARDIDYLFGDNSPIPGTFSAEDDKAARAVANKLYDALNNNIKSNLTNNQSSEGANLNIEKRPNAERQEAFKTITAYLNDYFGLEKQASVHGPG